MTTKLRALALRLLGSRTLSPLSAEMQALAFDAGIRTRANWLVPGLGALALALALAAGRLAMPDLEGFTRVFMRIFAIDLGIFAAAWLSGWNAARRWRMNRDLMEEVSLTPLRPIQFYSIAATGTLAAWVVAVAGLLLADAALVVAQPMSTRLTLASATVPPISAIGYPVAMALLLPALALSHLESVRLSHALFAGAALPSISLAWLAGENLLKILRIVVALSALGCIATGAFASLMMGALELTPFEAPAVEEAIWGLASVPALVFVIAIKRDIARRELREFSRDMILYQWHGAAESEFPAMHLVHRISRAQLLTAEFELEEAAEAPDATQSERRKLRARHDELLRHIEKWPEPRKP